MMKRYAMVVVVLALVTGCRAFNSSYSSPEADLASKPKAPAASESKPKDPAAPSDNAPVTPKVDYSKDTTECKTPDGVTVTKNSGTIMANAGWASLADGVTVTVTATKLGPNSATISMQKTSTDKKSSTVSFTVKQTADDKFSACNFSYSDGPDRIYQGVSGGLMVSLVNAADAKASTVTNSGAFNLVFTRSLPTATKSQSFYLGATTPDSVTAAGTELSGAYISSSIVESAAKSK